MKQAWLAATILVGLAGSSAQAGHPIRSAYDYV
jgi:hypothetical protein